MPESKRIKIVTEADDVPAAADAAPEETAPADTSGQPHAPTAEERIRDLEDRLAAKEKEYDETRDQLLRVSAEFENYRKRTAREMDDFRKYAVQSLLKEMLSAVDHIELAIQASASNSAPDKKLAEGLSLTLKELLRIFEKFKVMPIAAVGKPFNPEYHEAILREESDELAENTVLREMQKGYMIGSRLLRPALVVVAAPRDAARQSA
ncbi:MAG: nucleotide exchange factor GrpE [Deltaproteobacteria bacterium]|nr:nucleotide exchange factor GrpE [Deltaproteobacteria bacterium]